MLKFKALALGQPGVAGPLAQSADAIAKGAITIDEVVKVHGCNRVCRLGPVPRWGGIVRWHRHVGPAREPIRCGPL